MNIPLLHVMILNGPYKGYTGQFVEFNKKIITEKNIDESIETKLVDWPVIRINEANGIILRINPDDICAIHNNGLSIFGDNHNNNCGSILSSLDIVKDKYGYPIITGILKRPKSNLSDKSLSSRSTMSMSLSDKSLSSRSTMSTRSLSNKSIASIKSDISQEKSIINSIQDTQLHKLVNDYDIQRNYVPLINDKLCLLINEACAMLNLTVPLFVNSVTGETVYDNATVNGYYTQLSNILHNSDFNNIDMHSNNYRNYRLYIVSYLFIRLNALNVQIDVSFFITEEDVSHISSNDNPTMMVYLLYKNKFFRISDDIHTIINDMNTPVNLLLHHLNTTLKIASGDGQQRDFRITKRKRSSSDNIPEKRRLTITSNIYADIISKRSCISEPIKALIYNKIKDYKDILSDTDYFFEQKKKHNEKLLSLLNANFDQTIKKIGNVNYPEYNEYIPFKNEYIKRLKNTPENKVKTIRVIDTQIKEMIKDNIDILDKHTLSNPNNIDYLIQYYNNLENKKEFIKIKNIKGFKPLSLVIDEIYKYHDKKQEIFITREMIIITLTNRIKYLEKTKGNGVIINEIKLLLKNINSSIKENASGNIPIINDLNFLLENIDKLEDEEFQNKISNKEHLIPYIEEYNIRTKDFSNRFVNDPNRLVSESSLPILLQQLKKKVLTKLLEHYQNKFANATVEEDKKVHVYIISNLQNIINYGNINELQNNLVSEKRKMERMLISEQINAIKIYEKNIAHVSREYLKAKGTLRLADLQMKKNIYPSSIDRINDLKLSLKDLELKRKEKIKNIHKTEEYLPSKLGTPETQMKPYILSKKEKLNNMIIEDADREYQHEYKKIKSQLTKEYRKKNNK